ncbi:CAAX prenyl protease RCE1 [Aspergillus clavatus NRRL 1]|uniref:intramembrane prenyl-peptidase Rce1 n=1 Tax=Aspergillus clavatus (strain ATCC 1007 / CBS 513.65 / DSM 816 / NCTC 3887 / NRRL 1 / QM 1276 / 107) TaxID=344612 RepID=A1CM45_ASPCL|nr:CaaX prenyl proteinase Rce1 [Aspergillus clavatus NRRL 1]EAW08632.1 CaaX prenyl proteinase Rce1 [Aspergillus clavatus NRRL 1]
MAPVSLLARLRTLYSKNYDEPAISVHTAAFFSVCISGPSARIPMHVLLTLFYVVPFYISPTTRPSPTLSRDAPSVIRARIRAVTWSCSVSTLAVLWLIIAKKHASFSEALRLLGWWPISLWDISRALLLTAVLFTGPLFERGIAEGEWGDWIKGGRISETLYGWIGWRNYVAGPITEEIMFRSAIVPLHLLAKDRPDHIVFVAPLYFGIAHVHHFYEFRLTHPDTPIVAALLRSLFQFGYTTIFGWYATFLYIRTGSLLAVILAHSFCNWCGLPRLWGRVEAGVPLGPPLTRGKEDSDPGRVYITSGKLGLGWTVAYYILLVTGAIGFCYALWPLTYSSNALATFSGMSRE